MGCGCKKRKQTLTQNNGDELGGIKPISPKSITEQKDYREKVSDALKQFANLKIRKRNLRG
jgi:hypothetical protein